MIQIENVEKSFGEQHILKGVTTEFKTGKCNLIIGASGSGKTVLIKCLIGLYKADGGRILYDGRDLMQMSVDEKKTIHKQIGMLFQGSALFDSMTVEENIMFPLNMFSKLSNPDQKQRVREVLQRVNLPENAYKKLPAQISGGMQKRVGIARAIVLNPQYLFCDEPNSGLDPQTSLLIDKLIQEITEEYKMTTVINTHDMNSVLNIGDNIVYMFEGKLQWQGNRKDILISNDQKLNNFIFASEFMQELKRMENKKQHS